MTRIIFLFVIIHLIAFVLPELAGQGLKELAEQAFKTAYNSIKSYL